MQYISKYYNVLILDVEIYCSKFIVDNYVDTTIKIIRGRMFNISALKGNKIACEILAWFCCNRCLGFCSALCIVI